MATEHKNNYVEEMAETIPPIYIVLSLCNSKISKNQKFRGNIPVCISETGIFSVYFFTEINSESDWSFTRTVLLVTSLPEFGIVILNLLIFFLRFCHPRIDITVN